MAIFSRLPRLYPILDAGLLTRAGISIEDFARGLRESGVRFLQYRDKDGTNSEVLERASVLRGIFPASDSRLILNDRVALVLAARFDGVHVGQQDMAPAEVRNILGRPAIVGVSTHNELQLRAADNSPADYLAIGPVFATTSKQNPDPMIGLEQLRKARRLTSKPLVAIGGINLSNALAVLDAGADSIAILSDLLPRAGYSVEKRVREFLAVLEDSAPFSSPM